jgi:MFS transporter, PHS family, inorganic phosphate transporter
VAPDHEPDELAARSAILGAFVGALVFGRVADLVGRKKIYLLVAVVMVLGAVRSALATNLLFLVLARFVLGLGIGGDYPVSAVLMREYANRRDRGRLVGLVFSTQALGLIVGPLVALSLLDAHVGSQLTWRLLLGLGALPAMGVIYLRSKIPESPRFQSIVQGRATEAATELAVFSGGAATTSGAASPPAADKGQRRRAGSRQAHRLERAKKAGLNPAPTAWSPCPLVDHARVRRVLGASGSWAFTPVD